MKFVSEKALRVTKVFSGTSKAGNRFSIVTLADTDTFESVEFFVSQDCLTLPPQGVDILAVVENQRNGLSFVAFGT
jgi:hypothetical protein